MKRLIYISSLLIVGAFIGSCSNLEIARKSNPLTFGEVNENLKIASENFDHMNLFAINGYLTAVNSELNKMSSEEKIQFFFPQA